MAETDPNVNYRYAYTGRYFDEDTGLQYNRARWYDAEAGRFLSIDPILFNSGDANFYRYGFNGPGDPAAAVKDDHRREAPAAAGGFGQVQAEGGRLKRSPTSSLNSQLFH